ncbi:uncharacterized protein Dwil_GK26752 [Drosophila willistoni]|uniref:Ionotropic glutamate receptor C-terminal domain-containing protein n=1 Tax=Drosophila willistoni TaxID=7260 RepID=A0A0Q9WQC3_DROWI|nr:uncharacterized protein LOC26528754 [Drosophila willistoni]KRF98153.1 uncharacterized protein Dwil_GK26752 [Drosophila willistoni]
MLGHIPLQSWLRLLELLALLFSGISSSPIFAIEAERNISGFIHNVIKHLHSREAFESFVIFETNRDLLGPPHIIHQSLEYLLVTDLGVPIVNWGLRPNVSLRHLLGYRSMVFVPIGSVLPSEEPVLRVLTDALSGLQLNQLLFIYRGLKNYPPSRKQLKSFFNWCWQNKFLNVLMILHRIGLLNVNGNFKINTYHEVMSYTPFPVVTLLNMTGRHYNGFGIVHNVRGYEFHTPVFQDAPTVFQLSDGRLSGNVGVLFSGYVHHIKGRLSLRRIPNVNRYNYHDHTLLAAARGEIEMGVHPYSQMVPHSELTAGSFPLGTTNACLMVPWQRQSPPARFMKFAIHVNGCFLLVLLLAMMVTWQLWANDGSRGIYLAFAVFYLQSLQTSIFQRLTDAYKCIHVAALLAAFVLWTMRMGNLSSIFSAQVGGPQIDTVQDFLESPLRIMLTSSEVSMYFTANRLPSALKHRLLVVNSSTLIHHLNTLNTSFAYCSNAEHSQFLQLQQRRLRRPLFRLASPNLCTPTYFLRFPIQNNSPFEQSFYRFYIFAQQFGFWRYWRLDSYRKSIEMGLVPVLEDSDEPFKKLTLSDFQLLLKMYIASLMGCSLILLGEIMWNRCR